MARPGRPPDPATTRLLRDTHLNRAADTPESRGTADLAQSTDATTIADDIAAILGDIDFSLPFDPTADDGSLATASPIEGDPGLEVPAEDELLAQAFLEASDPQQDRWLRDPESWVRERVKGFLWSRQRDILQSVHDHGKTAVHTSHNVGKSWVAALAIAWWLDVHPPGTAFVITTAPTGAQVKAILWRYVNRLHATHKLPGRMNQVEWYIGNELVGLGRKPSEYTPDAFQGIHAEYVLAILDEAGGIDQILWDEISTMTSNQGSRTLAIGNPDDPDSYFARVCAPGSGWNTLKISAFDTPNLTGEEVPDEVQRSLISKEWVEDRANVWGTDSPIYISKVLGEFPENAEDGVVPMSYASQCRVLEDMKMDETPVWLGVDVGETTDRTVIVERAGARVRRVRTIDHRGDAMSAVGQIVEIINRTGAEAVTIDVIGLGWGVYGRLQELSLADNPTSSETTHSARIIRFSAGETAHNPATFFNKRAELWWDIGRELSRTRSWDLTQLNDDAIAELTTPKYRLEGSKGRVVVESKQDIRKRIGRSTDIADALLMAFYTGPPPPPPARFPRANRQLAEMSLTNDTQDVGMIGPR